jgi:putative endonuclease
VLARIIFGFVDFAARNGLTPDAAAANAAAPTAKQRARATGMRGETYAYWYLRRQGYLMVARNYTIPGMKGEIDMAGYDGRVLAFVEVKTRAKRDANDPRQLPTAEDAVDREKRGNVARMARQFLRARRIEDEPYRFDVLAIETKPGAKPEVRLHKGAYSG